MMTSFFFGGGFEIVFFLMFFLVFGVILLTVIRSIGQWRQNNNSPRLTVQAVVVSKRTDVAHHRDGGMGHTHTSYYVTFQVASGDRMELHVGGSEYGMLAEGDQGELSFQGTRYLGFVRQ